MDSYDTVESIAIGFVAGVCVMVLSLAAIGVTRNVHWQREAIQHGAAEYDRESGEFRWKDGK